MLHKKANSTSSNLIRCSTHMAFSSLTTLPEKSIYDDLILSELINQAKFPVLVGYIPSNMKKVAVKLFPLVGDHTDPCFENEILFSDFKNKNVISILHFEIAKDTAFEDCKSKVSYIVMELAPYGDFHDFVSTHRKQMHDKLVRTYFQQLVEGIEYLHSKGVAHLDLKLENLLLGENFTLKIADFDQSYLKNILGIFTKGTENFRAPELALSTCKDPEAADVYSVGIILFVLKCGGVLPYVESKKYKGVNMFDLVTLKSKSFWEKHCEIQHKDPSFFDEEFKSLFFQLVAYSPDKRLNIKEIKKSKWYNGPVYSEEDLSKIMRSYFQNKGFN